jgi:hypothetical protein
MTLTQEPDERMSAHNHYRARVHNLLLRETRLLDWRRQRCETPHPIPCASPEVNLAVILAVRRKILVTLKSSPLTAAVAVVAAAVEDGTASTPRHGVISTEPKQGNSKDLRAKCQQSTRT